MKIKIYNPDPSQEIKELLEQLPKQKLRYTTPCTIYHIVWLDGAHFCGVFGDGENAAYEWFDFDGERQKLETSDCGYGGTDSALRDVLNKAVPR